jgi:hypothetical protein
MTSSNLVDGVNSDMRVAGSVGKVSVLVAIAPRGGRKEIRLGLAGAVSGLETEWLGPGKGGPGSHGRSTWSGKGL